MVHKIAYLLRNLYICNMNQKIIYEYLSSAKSGNLKAQGKLCQIFFEDKDIGRAMPDDFWAKVDRIAQDGNDYANFIMHCRYFDDPAQSGKSYYYIRKAIRHKNVPLAILRLGASYAQGGGIKGNHTLANYYFDMALAMGCQEASRFIDYEYETGRRNLVHDVKKAINFTDYPTPQIVDDLFKRIERERNKKNYGILSKLREYLPLFYRHYSHDKAFDDILNNRDTVDADICYSISTPSNQSEFCVDLLESLLDQLFAPITQDKDLLQAIIELGYVDLTEGSERELLQCIVNLTSAYDTICERYNVEKKEIAHLDPPDLLPYIKVSFMTQIRRQAFRCLLSIKDIDPRIADDFLNNLDNEEQLLNINEEIKDKDVQLFLISFVELNIDIETIMLDLHVLLNSYRDHQLNTLAKHLNVFVRRLTDTGIKHQLPEFTPENLPPIKLNN